MTTLNPLTPFPNAPSQVNSLEDVSCTSCMGRTWRVIKQGLDNIGIIPLIEIICDLFKTTVYCFTLALASLIECAFDVAEVLPNYQHYQSVTLPFPTHPYIATERSQECSGVGFRNSGSSCFLISVLQALRVVPGIDDYLQDHLGDNLKALIQFSKDPHDLESTNETMSAVMSAIESLPGLKDVLNSEVFDALLTSVTLLLTKESRTPEETDFLVALQKLPGMDDLLKKPYHFLIVCSIKDLFAISRSKEIASSQKVDLLRGFIHHLNNNISISGQQEDAQEALVVLLDVLKVPLITYQSTYHYNYNEETDLPSTQIFNSFEKNLLLKLDSDNYNVDHPFLESLITYKDTTRTVPVAYPPDYESRSHKPKINNPTEHLKLILPLNENHEVSLEERQQLTQEDGTLLCDADTQAVYPNMPSFIPIIFARFKGDGSKNFAKITPSEVLRLPIAGHDNKELEMSLCCIVAHWGASKYGGHYVSYALEEIQGETQRVLYNDSGAGICATEDALDKSDTDIAHQGYIYFYKVNGIKDKVEVIKEPIDSDDEIDLP